MVRCPSTMLGKPRNMTLREVKSYARIPLTDTIVALSSRSASTCRKRRTSSLRIWQRRELKRRRSSCKDGFRPQTLVGGVPCWRIDPQNVWYVIISIFWQVDGLWIKYWKGSDHFSCQVKNFQISNWISIFFDIVFYFTRDIKMIRKRQWFIKSDRWNVLADLTIFMI